jgi:hypothetical protein
MEPTQTSLSVTPQPVAESHRLGDGIELSPISLPIHPLAEESACEVFLAWEKLRIAFNVTLGCVVLMASGMAISEPEFWYYLVWRALFANLCFCLGPVAEGYIALLGVDRRIVRLGIFVLGTLFGCLLAFACVVIGWHMRGVD